MAVTDYIFQEETVEKRNFGAWLVAKMVAAGWQQVSSNPPTAVSDPVSKFYMMKTKRDADNAEAYVGINDHYLRTGTGTYSTNINIELFTDYTPGTAGTSGTSTRSLTRMTSTSNSGYTTYYIFGLTAAYPVDTPVAVRFCITKNNVTLFIRPPSTTGVSGQIIFFGLPDYLQKERLTGGAILLGSGSSSTSNDSPQCADTTPGSAGAATMYEVTGYWLLPAKSPDAAGQFPLMPGFIGGTDTGLRHRIPSFFFVKDGGILDRDIIQVNGMNFEIFVSQSPIGDYNANKTYAYRIS